MGETTPAGWYPDPASGRLRYWDGAGWTDHFAAPTAPAAPPADLRAPEGTDPNTPWIWLHLFAPFLTFIPMLFLDWRGLLTIDPENPQGLVRRQFEFFFSAPYVLTMVLGILVYAATVVFAYLDYRELVRRGVPRPFHWAFAFLSNYVYPIGRGIIARRRTGTGIAVTWVAIALMVAGFAVGIAFLIWLMLYLFSQFPYANL